MKKWLQLAGLLIGVLGMLLAGTDWNTLSLPGLDSLQQCPRAVRAWMSSSTVRSLLGLIPGLGAPSSIAKFDRDPASGLALISREQLKEFDGSDPDKPILLGMNGEVFDVSSGSQFYGKEASYNCFAGRDSTRALTLGSLDPADVEKGWDVSDFNEQLQKAVKEQHEFYRGKYPVVGKIKESMSSVPDGTSQAQKQD